MKGVVEVGSQANEKAEEEEVRALDEEGILVKTGGQENDTGFAQATPLIANTS